MQTAYMDYAMSVIVDRALPDVRDGLKPVHRILYAMYEDNLTLTVPSRSPPPAWAMCWSRYHPHGDSSVYDALVRLAQTFSMRYPIGRPRQLRQRGRRPPTAYRYTEARLSKISSEMLRDIEKDTVDWDTNFDESRQEPVSCPPVSQICWSTAPPISLSA